MKKINFNGLTSSDVKTVFTKDKSFNIVFKVQNRRTCRVNLYPSEQKGYFDYIIIHTGFKGSIENKFLIEFLNDYLESKINFSIDNCLKLKKSRATQVNFFDGENGKILYLLNSGFKDMKLILNDIDNKEHYVTSDMFNQFISGLFSDETLHLFENDFHNNKNIQSIEIITNDVYSFEEYIVNVFHSDKARHYKILLEDNTHQTEIIELNENDALLLTTMLYIKNEQLWENMID